MQFISDGTKMAFELDENGIYVLNHGIVTSFDVVFTHNMIDITSINSQYAKKVPTDLKTINISLDIQGSGECQRLKKGEKFLIEKKLFDKPLKEFEKRLMRTISFD